MFFLLKYSYRNIKYNIYLPTVKPLQNADQVTRKNLGWSCKGVAFIYIRVMYPPKSNFPVMTEGQMRYVQVQKGNYEGLIFQQRYMLSHTHVQRGLQCYLSLLEFKFLLLRRYRSIIWRCKGVFFHYISIVCTQKMLGEWQWRYNGVFRWFL